MAWSTHWSKAVLWPLVSMTESSITFCVCVFSPHLFFGIIATSRVSACLYFLLTGGRRVPWETTSSWLVAGEDRAGEIAWPCVLRGRGRWGERVRNILRGEDLSMWNLTQNKALVVRVGGSPEYSAATVLGTRPWPCHAGWILGLKGKCWCSQRQTVLEH